MDITFKFKKTPAWWHIEWDDGKPCLSIHSSRTRAFNKMLRLIAPKLKDGFSVTFHIPSNS